MRLQVLRYKYQVTSMRLQKSYCNYQVALILGYQYPEMEYCASDANMLAEEIWQIAEGFVEVPAHLKAKLKKCGGNIPND